MVKSNVINGGMLSDRHNGSSVEMAGVVVRNEQSLSIDGVVVLFTKERDAAGFRRDVQRVEERKKLVGADRAAEHVEEEARVGVEFADLLDQRPNDGEGLVCSAGVERCEFEQMPVGVGSRTDGGVGDDLLVVVEQHCGRRERQVVELAKEFASVALHHREAELLEVVILGLGELVHHLNDVVLNTDILEGF